MNYIFYRFQHLLIAVLFLSLTACLKSTKETTIVGKVLTYGTEEIIDHPPVKVQLYREDPTSCWGCGTNYTVIDEMWTDSSMSFTLNAKLHTDETYFIGVDGETVRRSLHYIPPGYGHKELEAYRVKSKGGIQYMNYQITAFGWVRFHFFNTSNPIRFSYSVGGGGAEEFYSPKQQYIRLWDFGGNQQNSIAIGRSTATQDTAWREYFFVPAFDTIDISINF